MTYEKQNVSEPRGGGITGRLFIDGVEVFSQFIANDDDNGVQNTITCNVSVGAVIDFAINPTGVSPATDSNFSARADGSIFSAIISTASPAPIPEPSTILLRGMGGLITLITHRRHRTPFEEMASRDERNSVQLRLRG